LYIKLQDELVVMVLNRLPD